MIGSRGRVSEVLNRERPMSMVNHALRRVFALHAPHADFKFHARDGRQVELVGRVPPRPHGQCAPCLP